MPDRTSEYAHEVKWALNDLLRERSDQPNADEQTATRVGTNDPVTFARLAELVKFPVGVSGEIEPVDVACAAYAEYIATPEAMERYTELTPPTIRRSARLTKRPSLVRRDGRFGSRCQLKGNVHRSLPAVYSNDTTVHESRGQGRIRRSVFQIRPFVR